MDKQAEDKLNKLERMSQGKTYCTIWNDLPVMHFLVKPETQN
jgi:hypothetical protein